MKDFTEHTESKANCGSFTSNVKILYLHWNFQKLSTPIIGQQAFDFNLSSNGQSNIVLNVLF